MRDSSKGLVALSGVGVLCLLAGGALHNAYVTGLGLVILAGVGVLLVLMGI